MYQSPDFVKVNMNVSDVYSDYETTTKACGWHWYTGGNRTSETLGKCDNLIPEGNYTWVEAQGFDDTLQECGHSNVMN